MKTGKLLILLLVAVALCVWVVIAYNKQNPPAESADWRGKKLFPNLAKQVESIGHIEYAKGTQKLDLLRGDAGKWTIGSTDGYEADNSRINALVFNIAELIADDRLTKDKAKYDKFGVTKDEGEEGVLKVKDQKGAVLASMVLGKRREAAYDPDSPARPMGYYFRVDSDPYVYFTTKSELWQLEPKVSRWAEPLIVNIPDNDITDVAIDLGTSGTSHLVWDDGALKLANPPAGKKIRDSEVRDARSALTALRFDEVIGAKTDAAKGIEFKTTYTATSKDGTIYTVRGAQANEKSYITLSASYGKPFFTDDDKATTATMAAAEKRAADAKNGVAALNKKHGAWIYEVNSWTLNRLMRKTDDFTEKPTPPPPAKAPLALDISKSGPSNGNPAGKHTTAPLMTGKKAKVEKANRK